MPYFTPTQAVTPSSNMYGLHTTRNLKEAYLYACDLIDICLDAVRKTFKFESDTYLCDENQMPGMSPELQYNPKYDFIIEELVEKNESLEHAFAYKHIIRDYLAKKIEEADYFSCIESGDLIEPLTINPDEIEDSVLRKRVEELQSKYKRIKDLYNIWMLQSVLPVSRYHINILEKIIDITASVTGMSEEEKKQILFGGYGQLLSRRARLLEFLKSNVKVRNRFIQKTLKELEKCVNSNQISFNCQVVDLLKKIIKSQEDADSLSSNIDYHKLRKNIIDYLNYHLIKSMEDSIIEQSELRSQSEYSSSICDELLRVDLYSSISYWVNQQDNYELEGFDFIINTILELLSHPPKCTNFWDENDEENTKILPFPSSVLESFEPSTPIDLASFIAFAVYYRKLIFKDNRNINGPFCEPYTDGAISLCDLEVLNELIKEAEKPKKKHEDFPFKPVELRANHYKQLEASINTMRSLTRLDSTPYKVNSDIKELVEHEFKSALEKALNKPSSYVDINIDINLSINDILSHCDPTKISINAHDPELLEYQIRIELCRLCSSKYIPFSYSNTDKTINGTYYHIGSETFYLTRKQVESLLASLSSNPINHEVGKCHSLGQIQTT